MPINELNFDIGFDASEFRKGIEQAAKDVDKFVRKTMGKRAGVVQGMQQFGVGAINAASFMPGIQGGPIQRAISGQIYKYGSVSATKAIGAGGILAGATGIGAVAGAGLLGKNLFQASERRAEYVRQQAEDARRTLRPVSSLNFGAVNRQDVADTAVQDERFARARARVQRATAPTLQGFRGALSQFAQDAGDIFSGRRRAADVLPFGGGPAGSGLQLAANANIAYNRMLTQMSTGLPTPTTREQRRMDEQMSERQRAQEAIRQANRDDALVWEIR